MNPFVKSLVAAGLGGLLATQLAACGPPTSSASAAQQAAPTARPATPRAGSQLGAGIEAIGEVKPAQDANLTFQVAGTVAQVLVKEGDLVKKDQLLASLDTRSLDEKVGQAQAALQVAQAQLQSAQAQKEIALAAQAALTDPPKPAQVQAARAQVQAAQVALKQARTGQSQNVIGAQAALASAQQGLQSTKDKLSQAKTTAELQMKQAAEALTQAQARYAQAKSDWEYVQSTGNSPANPTTTTPQGKAVDNQLSDSQRQAYYTAFVQAEASMHTAEEAVETARVAYDTARQQEVTGGAAAEQGVVQAQAQLDKVAVPADQDAAALAQAQLALAQANLAALQPDPRPSDKARVAANVAAADAGIAAAQANVAQAQAALQQAQLSRAYAEIHAPYGGQIAQVNVDPFDSSTTVGQPAIRLVDLSKLRVEVQISDVDIGRVKVGQRAQVRADALDAVITGAVSYIAPEATVNGATRSYLVRIDIGEQPALRSGMPVTVGIATS